MQESPGKPIQAHDSHLHSRTTSHLVISETPLRRANELRASCGDGMKGPGKSHFSHRGLSETESQAKATLVTED